MEQLDTHFYDDKIKVVYDQSVANDKSTVGLKTFDQTVTDIFELTKTAKVDDAVKDDVYRSLLLLRRDSRNNVDHNGIRVEELLPRIWRILPVDDTDTDTIFYFLEQLADIVRSGPCNNGRINRLVQVYKCLV